MLKFRAWRWLIAAVLQMYLYYSPEMSDSMRWQGSGSLICRMIVQVLLTVQQTNLCALAETCGVT